VPEPVRTGRRAIAPWLVALACAAVLPAGCVRDDAARPVGSVDDPRLREGGVPPAQLTALDINMSPDQLAMLDPAYLSDGRTPPAIAGASRVGDDLVILRLRADAPRADAPEWSYAVDCRDGDARLLGAGIGVGAGVPSAASPAGVPEAGEIDRRRAFDLVCAHRVDCDFSVRGNRCEQAKRAWVERQQTAPDEAAAP